MKKKRVVVFGIFDGVHEGHRSLFAQALRLGAKHLAQGKPFKSTLSKSKDNVELIVIVGRDSASLKWKGKKPRHSEQERLHMVKTEKDVDDAVLGDEEQSSYKILQVLGPDVICLGYDQDKLGEDLKRWMAEQGKNIPVIQLQPYEASVYHNSFRA